MKKYRLKNDQDHIGKHRFPGQQYFTRLIFACLLICSFSAIGRTHQFVEDRSLKLKISKSGLNRISNPPYKIVQVTGDDSKFRIKYDDDGTNIYLMPMGKIGEFIEISIKNNAGLVQDLELEVSNSKGQAIIINSGAVLKSDNLDWVDISQMLRAMCDEIEDKFYVQNHKQELDDIDSLKVTQEKIYKYKQLVGGVFRIKNKTKKALKLDLTKFSNRFSNLKAYYSDLSIIEPEAAARVFIIQMPEGY